MTNVIIQNIHDGVNVSRKMYPYEFFIIRIVFFRDRAFMNSLAIMI
jgi:hypothetical protein